MIDKRNDLGFKLGSLVGGDGNGNDSTGNTTRTAQSSLGGNKDVGNILIFAQKWQVQQDFEGLSVSSHNNEFGNTAIQGLGGFVGSLAKLLVVRGLLDQVEDAVGQSGIG